MLAFLLRRLFQGLIVVLVVAMLAFVMFRFAGDPVNQMMGPDATVQDQQHMREHLGLADPLPRQYARFLRNALRLDFGESYQFKRPVLVLIGESVPATVELVIVSMVFALILGIALGIATALYPGAWFSSIFLALSLFGIAVPLFLIGIALIYVFSVSLGWLPSYGRGEVVHVGWWTTGLLTHSGLASLILPSLTLAIYQVALIMRLVRAEMLEVLRTEYVRFAEARGIAWRMINFSYAFKNTLIPVVTISGLQLGSMIGFSVITEMIFQWPGMGLLFLQSIQSVDIPVMSAYLLIVSTIIMAINVVVDLLYAVIDPRVRAKEAV